MPDERDPSVSEAEKIAAGLSKAQREALINAELDGNLGLYFARFISVPTGRGLVKARLATAVWSGVMISDRGLEIRGILQRFPATQSSGMQEPT